MQSSYSAVCSKEFTTLLSCWLVSSQSFDLIWCTNIHHNYLNSQWHLSLVKTNHSSQWCTPLKKQQYWITSCCITVLLSVYCKAANPNGKPFSLLLGCHLFLHLVPDIQHSLLDCCLQEIIIAVDVCCKNWLRYHRHYMNTSLEVAHIKQV